MSFIDLELFESWQLGLTTKTLIFNAIEKMKLKSSPSIIYLKLDRFDDHLKRLETIEPAKELIIQNCKYQLVSLICLKVLIQKLINTSILI